MTKAQTKAAIKALSPHLTVRYHSEHNEWRVSWSVEYFVSQGMSYVDAKTRNEAVAYYTQDAQDAFDTAFAMVKGSQ